MDSEDGKGVEEVGMAGLVLVGGLGCEGVLW